MSKDCMDILTDIKYIILELLDDEWVDACRKNNFETAEEKEACGDTYISTGSYITEESEESFRKGFIEENDADVFIDKLKANPDFRSSIRDLVKKYSEEKQLEV